MSGNEYAQFVYLLRSNEWVKVGISDDPAVRRWMVQSATGDAAELVESWRVGDDARLVEAIACRILAPHLQCGYEYFNCSVDIARQAVETAVVMTWQGDFSAFQHMINIPRRFRVRARMARPSHHAHRHPFGESAEHVFAFWRHRQTRSATEIMRAVRDRYGIEVSRQTVYNQTVGPLSGDRKK